MAGLGSLGLALIVGAFLLALRTGMVQLDGEWLFVAVAVVSPTASLAAIVMGVVGWPARFAPHHWAARAGVALAAVDLLAVAVLVVRFIGVILTGGG